MNLSELKNSFFTISDIYAERQTGTENTRFEMAHPRPTDAFLLFTEATAIYKNREMKPLYVPTGALVYIPRGCMYTIESHCVDGKNQTEVLLFEFTLHKAETTRGFKNVIAVSPSDKECMSLGTDEISIADLKPRLYKRLFSSLIDLFTAKNASWVSIYRTAYAIFELVLHNTPTANTDKVPNAVDVALEYLGGTEVPEKSIDEIAALCCMSVSGFEKQFKKLTGMTPIRYRTECRMAKVKDLLINRPEMNIDEISEVCGFYDPAHLCRTFKRMTGLTPKEFAFSVTNK